MYSDGNDELLDYRTSREKSIIDVLIFGNGHVLHHPLTNKRQVIMGTSEDYRLKLLTRRFSSA